MRQTFLAASALLDVMMKINQAWYIRDCLVTSLTLSMTKDQIEKDYE